MRVVIKDLHIFRRTFGGLERVGRGGREEGSWVINLEYIGALVPPEGPLIRRLSEFMVKRVVTVTVQALFTLVLKLEYLLFDIALSPIKA